MKSNLLKDWAIVPKGDKYVIEGDIYNDQMGRFADGERICTSRVETIDFTIGTAKTKNTIYNLWIEGDK